MTTSAIANSTKHKTIDASLSADDIQPTRAEFDAAQSKPKDHPQTRTVTNLASGALIGVGLLMIGLQRIGGLDIGEIWPFFIIAPGAAMLGASLFSKFGNRYTAALGATITTAGLLLRYQLTYEHFQSWAYAWALVLPFAAGAGLVLFGSKINDAALIDKGKHAMIIGTTLFVVGLVFFELIIGISDKAIFNGLRDSMIWPTLLIGGGFALTILRKR